MITFLPVFAAAAMVVGGAPSAHAGDASPWAKDMSSSARLIAARGNSDDTLLRAGVEIRLDHGWKTYWRYPGDSGIPPRFDFSASDNVKAVTVLWPAPRRFDDGSGGHAIGYEKSVVLPLRVQPDDSSRPVTLRLDLAYGVCETMCVPARADLELILPVRSGDHDDLMAEAEARVPVATRIGATPAPAIVSVRQEAAGTRKRVVVDVAAKPGAAVDLFAEGPTPQWALPLPKLVDGAPKGIRRFVFDLDGLPPDVTTADGATLKLTAIVGDRAIEAAFRVD